RGVHRGRLDEVVGLRRDVRELEEPLDLLADLPLGALDRVARVDLVSPESIDPRDGRVPFGDVLPEEPRQAVDGVRRREQRPLSLLGEPERRGPGHRGLPDAALATEEGVLERRALEYTTDRESTRLNSTHCALSYAAFVLTKAM